MATGGLSDLLKKPNSKVAYTEEQLQDWIKCANDPLYFMEKYMWVQHPIKGKIPFEAYEYQKKMINTFNGYKDVVSLLPRQAGKCFGINTIITIKNKNGDIYDIPVGIFEEYTACLRGGSPTPDIEQYRRK